METRRDRKTLKAYFRTGDIPTETQFAELIDSVPNLAEEGHVKSGPAGIVLFPSEGRDEVAGIYAKDPAESIETPLWTLAAGPEQELQLRNRAGQTVVTFRQDGDVLFAGNAAVEKRVTAGEFSRAHEISVEVQLPSDGRWHDLPVEAAAGENRPGCRVYGVLVYYRDPDAEDGRLLQSVASRCGGEVRIDSPRKHWWGWSGPAACRWKTEKNGVRLQVKGRPSRVMLQCRVTEMWNYTE